jgi:two-component system, chemotaxis family, CheB/CheR fusion protein
MASRVRSPLHVVGIGASAGGIPALQQVLSAFTLDSAAFVIVTHLPRGQPSHLREVLQRYTILDVDFASSGASLEANYVYVVPESENVSLQGNSLRFDGHGRDKRGSRNIDHFFRSLAAERKHAAVGVVLSGANMDGTDGLRAIHAAGGSTFVQSAETALFGTMPNSASAIADFTLDPGALGARLMSLLLAHEAQREAIALQLDGRP